MTEAIHLRAAGPDDLERLLAFARDFHAEDSHPLTAAGEEALRRLLRDPALGAAFLVLRSGTPVGYAVLCFGYSIEWGGREAFIDDLHVAPAHRGAGLGEARSGRLQNTPGRMACGPSISKSCPEIGLSVFTGATASPTVAAV